MNNILLSWASAIAHRMFAEDLVLQLQVTADRRLELLTDMVELLYIIRDHYQVNEITTGEMIERIEEELSSDERTASD